jgi:hypothetical protein
MPRFGAATHVDRFGDTRRRGRPRSAGGSRSFPSWRHGRPLLFQGSDAGRRSRQELASGTRVRNSRQGRGGWAAVDTDEGRAGRSRSLPATPRVGVAAHEGIPLGAAPGHRGPRGRCVALPRRDWRPGELDARPRERTRLISPTRVSDPMVIVFCLVDHRLLRTSSHARWHGPARVQLYVPAGHAWRVAATGASPAPAVGLVLAGDPTAAEDTASRCSRRRAARCGRRLLGVRTHDAAGWREPGPAQTDRQLTSAQPYFRVLCRL